MDKPYVPTDSLTLWYLGSPASPQLVGELNLQHGGRAVALAYGPDWLRQGFALSEDLPLASGLFVARQPDTAVGSVDDARPDRWGERIIRKFEVSPRLSILEYLLFAGDDRYGALGVSQRDDVYAPWHRSPLPSVDSLDEIAEVVRKVLANEPVPQPQRRLIQPGVSLGGARPKSLVAINGEQWLVKFPEGDELDMPLIEHATMKLARACGIDAAPTQALPLHHQHAVAIRRFDRSPGRRLHAISANVALRAAGETEMSYLHLSQLLRRLARADEIAAQQHELFRRMVFNIVMDNTDDHEKNHGLLRLEDGHHRLTPAFDVVPSAQGLGYQQMTVGDRSTESTLANALSQCRQFGLDKSAAEATVRSICATVDGWQSHFTQCGVCAHDIAVLAQFIDGERLGGERRDFVKSGRGHA